MKIRSALLILFIVSLAGNNSFAQSFHLGIKGGTDIHKITGSSFNDKFTYGYHLGGFAEIGLTKKWGVQAELLFSQVKADTGTHFSTVYQFNKIPSIKLSYLNIPLLLNYKPSRFLALQVGPQFGILMNQNTNLVQNGKDAFKKGDLSMLAGAQLEFLKFRIYGRYAIGLNNVNDIDNREKWKNQTIQLGIGISFL